MFNKTKIKRKISADIWQITKRNINISKPKKSFGRHEQGAFQHSSYQAKFNKNFAKAMDKNDTTFQHLCTLFPTLSSAKLKEGIFVVPQI